MTLPVPAEPVEPFEGKRPADWRPGYTQRYEPPPQKTVTSEFMAGARYVLDGTKIWITSPRLILIGIIPTLISLVIFVAFFVGLLLVVDDIAGWLTDSLTSDWSDQAQSAARWTVVILLVLLALSAWALFYTAFTLIIGDPWYERISEHTERLLGDEPPHLGVLQSILRTARGMIKPVLASLFIGLPLFLVSCCVPVIGQAVALILGGLIYGWLIALEVSAHAFERRDLKYADRRRALRAHRARTFGFGVTLYLVWLIPLLSVLTMPAAVAGGTMLARHALGLPTRRTAPSDPTAGH